MKHAYNRRDFCGHTALGLLSLSTIACGSTASQGQSSTESGGPNDEGTSTGGAASGDSSEGQETSETRSGDDGGDGSSSDATSGSGDDSTEQTQGESTGDEATSEDSTGVDTTSEDASGDEATATSDTEATETTGMNDDPRCEDLIEQDEGPYPQDCPERSNLHIYCHDALPFHLSGQVLDGDCNPIAGAQVLIWHACPSASGANAKPGAQSPQDPNYASSVYDHPNMAGQRGPNGESIVTGDQMYYGWVRSDAEGGYAFDTIRPGYYWDTFGSNIYRCTHIHVKLFVDGRLRAITQLYFPDDPFNARDPLFQQCQGRGDCMLRLSGDGSAGTFNFKLEA